MNVFACQFDIAWENKAANFAKVRQMLHDARVPRGSLVALPEMFATGFSMNVAAIAEPADEETARFLSATAKEFGVCLIAGVVSLSPQGKGRNEAVIFSAEGKEMGRYAKLHTFSPAGEHEHYERGNDVVTFDYQGWRVSPFVCYDLRFPEIFRRSVRQGAELQVVIANWPTVRIEHWLALLRARAIENQAYVIGVNRCGKTPKLAYAGRSLIIDPKGSVLADAGETETVLQAKLDREALLAWRREFGVLGDMRAG